MSIHEVATEEIHAELQRRKVAETAEIRKQIDEHKKAIRDLKAKIHGSKEARERAPRVKCDIPMSDRIGRVKDALTGLSGATAAQIAKSVGFDGAALKATLKEMAAAGVLRKAGNARGTAYSL